MPGPVPSSAAADEDGVCGQAPDLDLADRQRKTFDSFQGSGSRQIRDGGSSGTGLSWNGKEQDGACGSLGSRLSKAPMLWGRHALEAARCEVLLITIFGKVPRLGD